MEAKIDVFDSGKIIIGACGAIASIDNVVIKGDDVPDNLSVEPEAKLTTTWGKIKVKAIYND